MIKWFFLIIFNFKIFLSTKKKLLFDKTFPILTKYTNSGSFVDYSFSLDIKTKIEFPCFLEIEFPKENYLEGMGLNNPDLFIKTNSLSEHQNFISNISGYKIIITPDKIPLFKKTEIIVPFLKNPYKIGGTGAFKIRTKCSNQIIDENLNLPIIGISSPKKLLNHATVELTNSEAGQESSYIFNIRPSEDLKNDVVFRIIFPDVYNFDKMRERLDDFKSLNTCNIKIDEETLFIAKGDFSCFFHKQKHVIDVIGLNESIQKNSTIIIQIDEVLNPPKEFSTNFFEIQVMLKNSNHTVEYDDTIKGVDITPGELNLIEFNPLTPIPLVNSNTYDFILKFLPTNSFESIRIVTRFKTVNYCNVQNGLKINGNNKIDCKGYSNILEITGFSKYIKTNRLNMDLIIIKLNGEVSENFGKMLPMEIYTYYDNNFRQKVDQSIKNPETSLIIGNSPPLQTGSLLFTNSTLVDDYLKIEGNLIPLKNYTDVEEKEILIIFPEEYKLGKSESENPICFYENYYEYEDGPDVKVIDINRFVECKKKEGFQNILIVNLNNLPLLMKNPVKAYLNLENKISIIDIKNPVLSGNYDIEFFVLQNEEYLEKYLLSTIINPISAIYNFSLSNYNKNENSFLELQLDMPYTIDNSNQNAENYYEKFSKIILKFPQKISGVDVWEKKIGYTNLGDYENIQCWVLKGIIEFQGGLKCQLRIGKDIPKADGDYVKIIITNYKKIKKEQRIKLGFFIKNPNYNSPHIIKLEIYDIYQGEEKILLSTNINLQAFSNLITNPTFSYLNSNVDILKQGELTTIKNEFEITTDIDYIDNPHFIIKLPLGWKFMNDYTIKTRVFFDKDEIFTPGIFQSLFFEILYLKIPKDLKTGIKYEINFININIQNGESSLNEIIFSLFKNDFLEEKKNVDFGIINCSQITDLVFYSNLNKTNFKGTTYFFHWSNTQIYTNPIIFIKFPMSYYTILNTFDYEPSIIVNENLIDDKKIDVVVNNNYFSLKINDVDFKKNSKFEIEINFITNPNKLVLDEDFEVYIENQIFSPLINSYMKKSDCLKFKMETDFFNFSDDKYTAIIKSVNIFPQNEKFPTRLKFNFVFPNFLPKNSLIKIKISKNITIINTNSNIRCIILSGEINLIKDCKTSVTGSEKFIEFIILEKYKKNSEIEIDIIGYTLFEINNGMNSQVINDFYILGFYDNFLISKSNDFTESEQTIFMLPDNSLSFDKVILYVDPLNEGIRSEYRFFIYFKESTYIYNDETIWIRFPKEYDNFLSSYQIFAESNLNGALKIVVENLEVFLTGFYTQIFSGYIDLKLIGVSNPNKIGNLKTGNFTLAVLNSEKSLRFYDDKIEGVSFFSSPNLIELIELNIKDDIIRKKTDYNFLINSYEKLPAAIEGGHLRIYYPSDFIHDVFLSQCFTQDDHSLYSSCQSRYNLISIFSTNTIFDTLTRGPLNIDLNNLRNQEDIGTSGNLIIQNYDSVNKKILSRTFPNLSISYLNYKSSQLEIYINDNKPIILEVGSFSDPIIVKTYEKTKQRINIIPIYFDSKFIFNKNPIILKKDSIGDSFRIAVPQNMLRKRFYLTFTKSGDSLYNYYTLPKKIPVEIVKGIFIREISISSTVYVNRGGLSIPLEIKTYNPPYEQILIDIKVLSNNQQYFKLSKTTVELSKGQFKSDSKFLDISENLNDYQIEVLFSLRGKDVSSFELKNDRIIIPVNNIDEEEATIKEIEIVETTRSNIRLKIVVDKLAYIYCVIGYKFMPVVDFDTVFNRIVTDEIELSKPRFFESYVKTNEFIGFLDIDNLTAGMEYTMYCFAMNLNRIKSSNFQKIHLKANDPQRSATFTLKINEEYVSLNLRQEYLKRLSALMEIQSIRLKEKGECLEKSEEFIPKIGETYIKYYLKPDLNEEDEELEPIKLVRKLNTKKKR